MSRRAKVFLGLAGFVMVAGAFSVAFRPPSAKERLRTLNTELRALKDSAEACSAALATEQAEFTRYQTRVDSMRRRIADLEDIVPNGVPGDRYPEYLATVEAFNAAVPEWQPGADSLSASRRACQARIDSHRTLADSVRALAESLGLLAPAPANDR